MNSGEVTLCVAIVILVTGASKYCLEALVWSKHVRRRNRRDLRDLDLLGKHPCASCSDLYMASCRDLNPVDPSVPASNLYNI